VNLNITVQAAPWVPVQEVRIVKNGCVVQCFNSGTTPAVLNDPRANPYDQSPPAAEVVRFQATVSDTVTGDSYYIVEASPNLPSPESAPAVDAVVNSVAANDFPYGFTNPIFVDPNGGGYTGITLPAGKGEPACPALPASCSAGAVVASASSATTDAAAPPKGVLARLFERVVRPAVAGEESSAANDEATRLQKHEQQMRKSSGEYYPWHLVEFPTPRPDQITPLPTPQARR
jgi:hypothetical protein